MSRLRRALPRALPRALLSAAAALAPLAWTPAQAAAPSQATAPNLLVLELRLDEHLLSDALTGYQYGNDVFLPLGEVARLLTLAINTRPVEGSASGFVLSEERTFSLNVLERQVALSGRVEPVDRAQFKLLPDDIYVASRLLARWLPVDIEVDMSSLLVKVHAREQLPLQARLARSELLKRLAGTRHDDPGYPRQPTPYALAAVPTIDQTLGIDLRRGHPPDALYTAYLTGDLLGLQAAVYANAGRRVEPPLARVTLGRTDPDGDLLGPLHARAALAGSVSVPGVAGISLGSPTGNGFALSNRPLNHPTRFDRHTLQGDLPPGWDVELYVNDALVGFQASRPDGKYVFEDQPLVYGANEFRLVFHGPLGQVRVERQSFLLEQSLAAPGQLYYSVAEHRDGSGRLHGAAQFDLGLPGGLTASAGSARVPLFGGADARYANFGLRRYWSSFIAGVDAVKAADGGTLAHAELKTRVAGLSLAAGHYALRDFSSEIFLPSSDPIRSRDELRADGVLGSAGDTVLPVSLQVQHDRLASNATNTEVVGRISAYRAGTAFTNAVRWQSLYDHKYADGVFQLSRRMAGLGISGQLGYSIEPVRALSTLALFADKNLAQGYQLNLGVLHTFDDPHYDFSAALNKSLGSFGLGVNARYSPHRDYGAGLQLFLALGREPRSASWHTDAVPMAVSGGASVRVFLDRNLDNVMDAGDEPIKGAGFTVNGGYLQARTDAAGIAYLSHLPPDEPADIALDPRTLDDPQWVARQPGVRIVPRQGKVAQLEFPVIVTGEIDGTAWLLSGGAKRGAGDLEIELVDTHRKVVARARSAADGYFVLSNVAPGDYLLRVARAQLRRLGLTDLGMHLVTITPDGAFVNGRELYVEAAGEPGAPELSAN